MSAESEITFFSQGPSAFPEPTDSDQLIDTVQFLEASKHLADFFELLGTIFKPVKADIGGNVEKLQKYRNKYPERSNYLNNIIVAEASNPKSVAIDALLWLKRALEFTMLILEGIVNDAKSNNVQEDISVLCWKAYEQTLKQYHGWMVSQLFSLVMKACPWRKDLLNALALGKPVKEEVIINQMDVVLVNLRKCIAVLNSLYTKYNLNSDDKA